MFEKTTLPNGLRIISSTMPHTKSVAINIYVGAGSRYETDEEAGISHYLEHMLFKGTEKYPTSKEITEAVERGGGYMNAATDKEMTVYWCKVARPDFKSAVDVMTDIYLHSRFDKKDWEKERQVIIEELASTDDQPQQIVDLMVDELVWPGHPLGRDIGGSKESVSRLMPKTAIKYMAEQYVPNNTVISVAGNITHKEVVDNFAKHMESMKRANIRKYNPAVDGQLKPRMKFDTRKTEQAHVCIAMRGISSRSPERYSLDMLNTIFGEGMSSRLFMEIREKLGLAYEVHSGVTHYRDTGSIVVYAGIDPRSTPKAISGIIGQIKKIKKPVKAEELKKAKDLSKGRMLLRMEDTRAVAGWAGVQELLLDEVKEVEDVIKKIDRVKVDDMEEIAEKLMRTDKMSLAIVGAPAPEARLEDLLAV